MIVLPLLQAILIATVEPDGSQPHTMVPEIAQSRISFAIEDSTSTHDRNEALIEVVERCQDAELRAIAYFNLGFSQVSQEDSGDISQAIESMLAADRSSHDPQLRARCRFELGHMYYLMAEHTSEPSAQEQLGDIQAMLDSMNVKLNILKESAGAFRSVFEVVHEHKLALSNLERVRREMKALQDQINSIEEILKQQKEQQKQQQQDQQDAADKLDELAKEQQSQADESQSSPPQTDQEQQKQQEKQQELRDETGSAKDEISKQQEDTQAVQDKIQEAQEAQKRAQEAMEKGDHQQAADEQSKAAEALKEAAEKMQEIADETKKKNEGESEKGDDTQDSQQDAEPKNEGEQENDDEQQGDEISEIAKELLDKERREREARQAYRATGRPTQVEKDW